MKHRHEKTCTKCRNNLPLSGFGNEERAFDGVRCQCKNCQNEYERERYAKSESRRFSRFATMIKRHFGMTGKQYKEMLKVQNGVCAICGNTNGTRRLAVDHCHATGKTRGLLCMKCNTGIGQFNNNPDVLRKAANYLQNP